jgi:hypothetical protein
MILTQMASVLQIASPDAIRRIQRVQTVTIAWMSVEAAVSLFAAWRASSPALLAFGGDSAIELFSAVVVLWRFRASAARGDAERKAACVAGTLLFALAAFVAASSVTSLLSLIALAGLAINATGWAQSGYVLLGAGPSVHENPFLRLLNTSKAIIQREQSRQAKLYPNRDDRPEDRATGHPRFFQRRNGTNHT